MFKLKFLLCIVCAVTLTVLCSCKDSIKPSTSSAVASSTKQPSESDVSDSLRSVDRSLMPVADITSEQVKAIKANSTYKQIIDALPETGSGGYNRVRVYTVDQKQLLMLTFDNESDVCALSGDELLAKAKSLTYPNGKQPKDTHFGFVVTDRLFFQCDEREFYSLITANAKITFSDGKSATEDDLKAGSALLVSSDYVLDSYPGQIHCTEIVILK